MRLNQLMARVARVTLILVLLTSAAESVRAHREDFIDETLVYQTLERGEFEPEYWFDYGHRSGVDHDFTRHNLAAEYGLTEHWMIDARGTMVKEDSRSLNFDSARVETRYRFFDEGTLPVDIAISGEVDVERDEDGVDRSSIEPRLVLSRDFQKLNLTVNLSEEITFDSRPDAFLVSSGFRYDTTELFRFGSELKYDTENREGAAVPQIWLAFAHDITLKFGYSVGFDRNPEDFFRTSLELGF